MVGAFVDFEEFEGTCRRLIRDGIPDVVPRVLDDQHRYIPLGIDIDGNMAVVLLLMPQGSESFGHGPTIKLCLLQRHGDDWDYLGGGGGPAQGYPLAARRSAAELDGRYLQGKCFGHPASNLPRWLSWRPPAHFADLQAAAEVEAVRAGTRTISVPFHGHVAVIMVTRHRPIVEALAADGTPLQTLDLNPPLRPDRWPWRRLRPRVKRYGAHPGIG